MNIIINKFLSKIKNNPYFMGLESKVIAFDKNPTHGMVMEAST